MNLSAARTLAWALWLGGWLVLGEMGRDSGPLRFGGLWPLALWLALIGLLLQGAVAVRVPARLLGWGLVAAAALAAVGLLGGLPLLAAAGWAALVVGASRVVRALRVAAPGGRSSPVGPACAGALLAWVLAGNLPLLRSHSGLLALSLGAAALGLAILLPRGAASLGACRAGLFDCAFPIGGLALWGPPGQWPTRAAIWAILPTRAAMWAMLPMMAALPLMAERCSALGWPAPLATAAHLAAMLLPGALLTPWLRHAHLPQRRQAVAGLLVLGGAALWAWPGAAGLMAAALLHGAAWSLAWAGALAGPAGGRASALSAAPSKPMGPLRTALGLATAALALGWALDQWGLAALVAVHGLLALAGLVGALSPETRHAPATQTL